MKIKVKLIGIIAVCVFSAGLLPGCANPQKDGTEALEAGNYEAALTEFKKAAESDNKEKSAEGYRGLGMAYYEMQDYAKALEAFEQAADKGVDQSVQLYHLMGICAMQSGDYEKALEYTQTGLALVESDSSKGANTDMIREMKYNEIVCCEQLSDWETARQKVEKYLNEYPDDEAVQKEAEFLKTR